MTYFCPALDPSLGRSGRKTTTLVRDHEYFIPIKFHQNPSSGSGEEVENVKFMDAGRRTTDGRRAMTIAHLSAFGSGELTRGPGPFTGHRSIIAILHFFSFT